MPKTATAVPYISAPFIILYLKPRVVCLYIPPASSLQYTYTRLGLLFILLLAIEVSACQFVHVYCRFFPYGVAFLNTRPSFAIQNVKIFGRNVHRQWCEENEMFFS